MQIWRQLVVATPAATLTGFVIPTDCIIRRVEATPQAGPFVDQLALITRDPDNTDIGVALLLTFSRSSEVNASVSAGENLYAFTTQASWLTLYYATKGDNPLDFS